MKVAQSCPTLCDPWANPRNSPGQNTGVSSLSLLLGSSQPRDWTRVSHIAGGVFTRWATREAQSSCKFSIKSDPLPHRLSRPNCLTAVSNKLSLSYPLVVLILEKPAYYRGSPSKQRGAAARWGGSASASVRFHIEKDFTHRFSAFWLQSSEKDFTDVWAAGSAPKPRGPNRCPRQLEAEGGEELVYCIPRASPGNSGGWGMLHPAGPGQVNGRSGQWISSPLHL